MADIVQPAMAAIPDASLVLVAGGLSRRIGNDTPKQFIELAGRSILLRALDAFAGLPWIIERVVVLPTTTMAALHPGAGSVIDITDPIASHALVRDMRALGVDRLVTGGSRRQDSVHAGLSALISSATLVLIHDAARPLVSRDVIERVAAKTAESGAAIPVVPLKDTIKRVSASGQVIATLPRAELRAVQTPQAFERAKLVEAYKRYNQQDVTDDAAIYELDGHKVWTVEGSEDNIKITTGKDLDAAREILKRREGKRPS